jgi:hypothetical protein
MIDSYLPGEEIWIAEGTLIPRWAWAEDSGIPTPSWAGMLNGGEKTNKLNWAFVLKDGVKIYGGFAGTEITQTDKTARNPALTTTTLSGDFGSGNTFHVVLAIGITGDTLLEDVKVSGGANLAPHPFPPPKIKINEQEVDPLFGGGVYTIACGRKMKFSRLLITGNVSNEGGGMKNYSSAPTIEGGIISNNKAYYGGGVSNSNFQNIPGCTPLFMGTIISGNQAENGGGGVFNEYAAPVFDGVVISSNEAGAGGGLYANQSILTIRDSQINENKANSNGGGLCAYSSNVMLDNVRVRNNSTTGTGGGLFLRGISSFDDETYQYHQILTNMEISGNTAYTGGGIYMSQLTHIVITNVTISGNKASRGGPLNFEPYLPHQSQVYNSIIWGNTPAAGEDMNMTEYYNTLVEGSTANPGGFAGKAADLFENPSAGSYRLKTGSPAIDGGNNSYYNAIPRVADTNTPGTEKPVMDAPGPGPNLDLAGNKRIKGVIDMGAYEK